MARPVEVREVQEHYARWEILKPEHNDLRPAGDVGMLGQPELERLVSALAARRKNSMHNMLVEAKLSWEESDVSLGELYAPGVDPRVDPVIHQAGGIIAEVARTWKGGSSPYDADLKKEFRTFEGPLGSAKLIAVRRVDGPPVVIDGIHRGVGLAIMGRTNVTCYLTRDPISIRFVAPAG